MLIALKALHVLCIRRRFHSATRGKYCEPWRLEMASRLRLAFTACYPSIWGVTKLKPLLFYCLWVMSLQIDGCGKPTYKQWVFCHIWHSLQYQACALENMPYTFLHEKLDWLKWYFWPLAKQRFRMMTSLYFSHKLLYIYIYIYTNNSEFKLFYQY